MHCKGKRSIEFINKDPSKFIKMRQTGKRPIVANASFKNNWLNIIVIGSPSAPSSVIQSTQTAGLKQNPQRQRLENESTGLWVTWNSRDINWIDML